MFESNTALGGHLSSSNSKALKQPAELSDGDMSAVRDWLANPDPFVRRHIGPDALSLTKMLEIWGYSSLEALIENLVPSNIRLRQPLKLPRARSEQEALADLKSLAAQNQVFRSYLGMGYHDCLTPPVIQRNILENPGWYTQYTPYQAEIAQGRLEALLNYQTMICDLTGMSVANASLLDESTAAAEAMTLCRSLKQLEKRNLFFVSETCHPQTIDVVRTRAKPLGIEVMTGNHETFHPDNQVFGMLVQYPATDGTVFDYSGMVEKAHAAGAMVVVAADILSLVLLRPPGEFGADVAIGSTQRFGVPLGYGGPHAAYFATQEAFKRHMPGRIVGVTKDSRNRPALRLALQTREQHIRREKATSNICTAQVLLAIMASMYAVYHGPEGLKRIARRIHGLAKVFAEGLKKLGYSIGGAPFFDTVRIELGARRATDFVKIAETHRVNLRVLDEHTLSVSLDETTALRDVQELWQIFNNDQLTAFSVQELASQSNPELSAAFARTSPFLTHPVFHRHHSETEMLRYLRRLESRDLSLTTSMIPLGSCTMKLNATAEMFPVSWPEFARIHPFAPLSQTQGYQSMFRDLELWLAEITGFSGVSLQPNAGSQGEYTGLLTIRNYLDSSGQGHRKTCLIPQSAHGTNPASAVMAGLKVIPVLCDQAGNIDVADLRAKAAMYQHDLGVLMVTYPSTHGVFEESIKEICQIIHDSGGQVYMDGANLNAQVGLCRPADMGADVCHINLHKTFSIPHGGGGPGMGPICVAQHLIPFLPGHSVVKMSGKAVSGAVSASPWGSASILPISWIYIAMMGAEGLTQATKVAILNANYIAKRLSPYFPTLYQGRCGLVAHECILDLRRFKSVSVEDVAKRLMDYGFHAPTISWPVPGTMMVEPTESESQAELDRFCEAMIAIHAEMHAIETGQMDKQNNLLKNSPHPADVLVSGNWERPYTREQAAYPAAWLREFKFWPAVGRIDNVHGDRNPLCTCAGMDAYS